MQKWKITSRSRAWVNIRATDQPRDRNEDSNNPITRLAIPSPLSWQQHQPQGGKSTGILVNGGNSQTYSSVKHQVNCWSHVDLHLWSSYPALCQFLHDKPFFISQFQNLSSWLFSLPLLYLSVGFLTPKSSSFQVCIPTILSHSLKLSHHYLPEAKCLTQPISVSYRLETSLMYLQHRPLPLPWPSRLASYLL